MQSMNKPVWAAALAGALAAVTIGMGAAPAGAEPPPPPPGSDVAPDWAPRKPAETWNGQPVVWWDGDPTPGGHWGVWINGGFINLT